jgi:thymidine kinase
MATELGKDTVKHSGKFSNFGFLFYIYSMIEVICGPMFSGKTDELIRRLNRLRYANVDFLLFKPKIDDRYNDIKVVSHDGRNIESIPVDYPEQIQTVMTGHPTISVIAIDEIQFLDTHAMLDTIKHFDSPQTRIILSGLDMDYNGKAFNIMKEILPIADKIDKLTAVCLKCGQDAKMSYKAPSENTEILEIGGSEMYEARCLGCWYLGDNYPK